MPTTKAYAANAPSADLTPFSFDNRALRPKDVAIEILFCGVCHSDLHQVKNEWGNTVFPIVPGHEIVGRVTAVGAEASKFKVGDLAGVGCMVDSCKSCPSCAEGLEQYCEKGFTGTYNGRDRQTKAITYGGYSDSIVVNEDFGLHIPKNLDLAAVAPLLCAGITTYSPLHHWKVGPGQKVGVVGLGGLGHMALKIAHAMGAKVVLFTTSAGKKEDAHRFGADEVVITKDPAALQKHANTFDFIIDTVSAPHDLNAYLALLKRQGTLTLVGVPPEAPSLNVGNLIFKRRHLAGSLIGGVAETQEMLDFCGKHGITSDIEIIPIQKINEAYERMLKSDVKYRFVIDMTSLKAAA